MRVIVIKEGENEAMEAELDFLSMEFGLWDSPGFGMNTLKVTDRRTGENLYSGFVSATMSRTIWRAFYRQCWCYQI